MDDIAILRRAVKFGRRNGSGHFLEIPRIVVFLSYEYIIIAIVNTLPSALRALASCLSFLFLTRVPLFLYQPEKKNRETCKTVACNPNDTGIHLLTLSVSSRLKHIPAFAKRTCVLSHVFRYHNELKSLWAWERHVWRHYWEKSLLMSILLCRTL